MRDLIIDKDNEKAVKLLQKIEKSWKYNKILICWAVWVWKTFLARKIFKNYKFFKELKVKPQLIYPDKYTWNVWKTLAEEPRIIYDDFWICNFSSKTFAEATTLWLEERLIPYEIYESCVNKKTKKEVCIPVKKYKKTIVTTNLSLKKIKNMDARIASRLLENTLVIEISWPDRRESSSKILRV